MLYLLVLTLIGMVGYEIFDRKTKIESGEYQINLMLLEFEKLKKELINNKLDPQLGVISPEQNDVIALYFCGDENGDSCLSIEQINDCYRRVLKAFPNNNIVTLPDSTVLKSIDKKTLKSWRKMVKDFLEETEEDDNLS